MSLSLNGLITWATGNSEIGDQYAANAALQWKTLLANKPDPVTGAWQNAYNALLASYGPPGADVLAQFESKIATGAGQGFVEGVKDAADTIASAGDAVIGGTLSTLWRSIPTSVKLIGGAVLAVYVYNLGMQAGLLPSPSQLAKKIKK